MKEPIMCKLRLHMLLKSTSILYLSKKI